MVDREPAPSVFLIARTTVGPRASFQQLRAAIHTIDPGVPVSQSRTLDRALLEANWQIRFYTWLFGIFSLIAVVLASAGVYGVMSFAVASRSREFGLRMAVGAQPRQVTLLVLRRVMTLSALGLTLGLLGSLGGARLLSGMLFQVSSTDLGVFFFATAAMAIIALIAGYFPTRRILRIQPMQVLREE
jgi:putative ABC transport system permease protein